MEDILHCQRMLLFGLIAHHLYIGYYSLIVTYSLSFIHCLISHSLFIAYRLFLSYSYLFSFTHLKAFSTFHSLMVILGFPTNFYSPFLCTIHKHFFLDEYYYYLLYVLLSLLSYVLVTIHHHHYIQDSICYQVPTALFIIHYSLLIVNFICLIRHGLPTKGIHYYLLILGSLCILLQLSFILFF